MPCRADSTPTAVHLSSSQCCSTCRRRTLHGVLRHIREQRTLERGPPGLVTRVGFVSMVSTRWALHNTSVVRLRRINLACAAGIWRLSSSSAHVACSSACSQALGSGLSCRIEHATWHSLLGLQHVARWVVLREYIGGFVDWLARVSSQNESERERKETPCLLVPTKVGESSAQIQMRACNRAHVSTYTCAFSSIGGASRKAHARSRGCTLSRMHALADARSRGCTLALSLSS
jgi:hypothetical protein